MPTTWIKTTSIGKKTIKNNFWAGQAAEEHTYQVFFSDENANAVDAITASGLPTAGDQLLTIGGVPTGMYLQCRDAEQNESDKRIWNVKITWATIQVSAMQPQPSGLSKWNVNVSMNWQPREETITSDIYQTPIANSAGDLYEEKLTVAKYDVQISVNFWTAAPDWANISSTLGKINTAPVTITVGSSPLTIPARQLKFDTVSCSETFDGSSTKMVQMTYVFTWRYVSNGWDPSLDDIGYNRLGTDASGKPALIAITDGANQPVSTPQFLDGTGKVLATGAKVVQRTFIIYKDVSFAPLLKDVP